MVTDIDTQSIHWLFFDLDDTLVNSSLAYREALAAVTIDADSSEFTLARKTVKNFLGEANPSARNRLLYFKTILENRQKFNSKSVLTMMRAYEETLYHHLQSQWHSLHRPQLFSRLAAKYKMGIVTNENTRTQLIKLNAIDPHGDWFQFILTSEEVGVEKPHAKIFVSALERAQTSAHQVLMIGDSLTNDIEPGNQLGMQTLHTVEFLEDKNSLARNKIGKLADLADHLL